MLYISADHQGRDLQGHIIKYLESKNIDHNIIGSEFYSDADSYVKFAKVIAVKILSEPDSKGILICGSGQGVTIAANRFRGVRAGLCWDAQIAQLARADDDINVLCLPAIVFKGEESYQVLHKIIDNFLETPFKTNPKYQRRSEQLDRLP